MAGELYRDTISEKYALLINSILPGFFRSTYYGDPIRIPESSLPALIIYKNTTSVKQITNAEDEHQVSMTVNIVVSVASQINDDMTVRAGVAALYDVVEGRDDNYKLKDNCVLNILRHNQVMDAANNLRTDLATLTRVDYGLTFGKRQQDAYSTEALIEFVANFIQLR